LKRLLRWLLPAGFRGQVAGILLLGLALSQVLAAVLYVVLLPQWQRVLRPDVAVTRVAMVVQLLEAVSPADRARFAALWDEPEFRIRYLAPADTAPQPPPGPSDPTLRLQLIAKLERQPAQVQAYGAGAGDATDLKHIAVLLRGGGLIQVVTRVGLAVRIGLLEQLAAVAFLLFATGGLWAWLTWTVNHPLERFARTAERVGIDVQSPPLPERGPAQLKRAIRAFNEMQIRLQRLLNDRTLMLGAISHDLGTPLTRLRLRIETDRAADDKAKMLADIETMHTMLTSAQSFIRGVDDAEARAIVDLDSLLQTVCDLICDLGGDVTYGNATHSRYQCKPQAMLRALTNIVANAVKYGEHASVCLQELPGRGFMIDVQDDGPGIPDTEKAKVFEPFYRTDAARGSDQQGMGLGLSIARSIILAHGGTIELHDRQPRGLSVQIFLPESSAGSPPVAA
jgi:signal transduction histidine kinase